MANSEVDEEILASSRASTTSIDATDEKPKVPAPVIYQRSWYTRVPFTSNEPPPPPGGTLDDARLSPELTASWWNLIFFGWITPLLALGYARPLEATDLYKLGDERSAAYIAEKITTSFDRRHKEATEYNTRLANGDVKPGWRVIWWTLRGKRAEREKRWREIDGKRRASLIWAMNDSVKWLFWSGGALKVIGDTAQITSPLVVKAIINFGTSSYTAHREGGPIPPIGTGVGLAIALLLMQLIASICQHQFFYRAMGTGVLVRGGLITAIYSRSLHLTSRARSTLTNGKLVNHISSDVSRIDFCAGFFHMSWTAPIQMIICLILLILNLGPSALAGFAFFVLATPAQTMVMKRLFVFRQKSMVWTDNRAKMLQEILGGMKIIKLFNWQAPFLARISGYRQKEMAYIRSLLLLRSGTNAVAMSMPALASVLAFVTYSLTGHTLEPSILFASLTLFNLLRLPLMFLPIAFSTIADALNASQRLHDVFVAETFQETQVRDKNLDFAIEVDHATFTWDGPPPDVEDGKKKKGRKSTALEKAAAAAATARAVEQAKVDQEKVFKMSDLTFSIPRGQLVAIVGAVGSGKTTLLQGMIGECRRTTGYTKFGGSVSYCPQSAWIQNATIRENVCFGLQFEEDKYWKAITDSCLQADLEMLPNGDLTEVGEKGISLSGGQRQRLNICRSIYSDSDIQIFDDPLSALDAHVGKNVFHNVLQNTLSGKTRILVTHALHFLPHVDYIMTVADGRIAERGTYAELIQKDGEFAKFVAEFGSNEHSKGDAEEVEQGPNPAPQADARKKATAGAGMMQTEERNIGSIDFEVYKAYISAGNGKYVVPLLILSLVLLQGSNTMSSYWLVYWQEKKWPRSQGFYMGIYSFFGVSQAITFFFMGSTFAMLTYFASQTLHKRALTRVMHAPMSFYETTPLGRILHRFTKDCDTIDSTLGEALRMFFATFANIVGAIILIAVVLPWFLIAVACVLTMYVYFAAFYRSSAREIKRLDALLRSALYTHFSESLSGLATIRAYGVTERFLLDNERLVDTENRAYWLTVTNQRWLGIRLDFLGSLLTFVVSMLAVGTRFTVSPSQTGLVLAYILSVQQAFSWMVRQSAEVENDMNSVERVLHYATEVEQEAAIEIPDKKPAAPWPSRGQIEMKDVVLKYRPELPAVIKGISMNVQAGEKIGIVGRTGAGKSSIMTALFRLVELTSGSITIDGVDISQVGLGDLRSGVAIIPQEPLLFSGTLRTNLDPFSLADDATLWDALRRAYLVESTKRENADDETPSGSNTPMNKFSLDTVIEDEGNNLSVGQRSLVSLARALVKDAPILVLDEATASVDYETDRKIQDTITHEFEDRTILCIAHRLSTIIAYDRICVMDAGQIAEFDTPASLFLKQDGIFRGMCDKSSISLDDIKIAAKTRAEMRA